jgi:3D (Asp-Asp-Asp) domain-containing protein
MNWIGWQVLVGSKINWLAQRRNPISSIGHREADMAPILRIKRIKRIEGIALILALAASSAVSAAKCDLKKGVNAQEGRFGLCKFDAKMKSFEGTSAQQAACLTREVKRTGKIGDETITPFLKMLAGKPAPTVQAVQALLDTQQIKPADVGGPINKPISANYFIVHDTSTPNCSALGPSASCPARGQFPLNRDDASWNFNQNFGGHPKLFPNRIAHAYTNRVGASITEVDFADRIATTKFESCVDVDVKAGLFVGIENIQPRIGDPKIPEAGKKANDFDAPTPGFTTKQYERLALLYTVASARRGVWLIPAFHAVLDHSYADGHDDPQRFDMTAFSAAVQKHSKAIPAEEVVAKANIVPTQAKDGMPKHAIPALNAATCKQIAANVGSLRAEKTRETTQFFTPIFRPGPDGDLRKEDRKNCLQMEGACIVGNFLYNADGQRFDRDKVKFIFGQGPGISDFNKTNALIPCRTLAADKNHYKIGTVIYVPSFEGKICPQSSEPVDGCFIVGDVGSAIKGKGRFDIFTGECSHYDSDLRICRDTHNVAFNVPANTEFRIVPSESEFAAALRKEVDSFIDNGWKPASQ